MDSTSGGFSGITAKLDGPPVQPAPGVWEQLSVPQGVAFRSDLSHARVLDGNLNSSETQLVKIWHYNLRKLSAWRFGQRHSEHDCKQLKLACSCYILFEDLSRWWIWLALAWSLTLGWKLCLSRPGRDFVGYFLVQLKQTQNCMLFFVLCTVVNSVY